MVGAEASTLYVKHYLHYCLSEDSVARLGLQNDKKTMWKLILLIMESSSPTSRCRPEVLDLRLGTHAFRCNRISFHIVCILCVSVQLSQWVPQNRRVLIGSSNIINVPAAQKNCMHSIRLLQICLHIVNLLVLSACISAIVQRHILVWCLNAVHNVAE